MGQLHIKAKWIYTRENDVILRRRTHIETQRTRLIQDFDGDEDGDQVFSDTEVPDEMDEYDMSELEGIIVEQDEETQAEKALREAELSQQKQDLEKFHTSIKRGEYQVQVHVIEARDLKGEDLSGSSDPVCYIEVLGQKKKTETKKNTVGYVEKDGVESP